LLRTLGIAAAAWDGAPTRRLVVIGRNAYAKAALHPSHLERHLNAGGRALVMASGSGLAARTAWPAGRRVPGAARLPGDRRHPALAGLDAEAFRDWAGESRLVGAD